MDPRRSPSGTKRETTAPPRAHVHAGIQSSPREALVAPDPKQMIEVIVSPDELEVLLSIDLHDHLRAIVEAAVPGEDGMLFKGRRTFINELAGWVAREANHERKAWRADLLNDACDAIELALRTSVRLG